MQDVNIQQRSGGSICRPLLTAEQATLRSLSERFGNLQRGLRILECVNWGAQIEAEFFAHNASRLPRISPDWYQHQPLALDPCARGEEFRLLERDIRRSLGVAHPGAQLLLRRCRESRLILGLLQVRGTAEFGSISDRLYGSVPGGEGLSAQMHRLADKLGSVARAEEEPGTLGADEVVQHLHGRLAAFFGNDRLVRVRTADDLAANAAASLDTLKIRRDARFSPREVHLLEVHEGWVHLGTTLNAQSQPVCTFLSKCLPSATTTQEGLAVLVEVLAGASHVQRLERLALRVEGITWARQGADFLQVYRRFCDRGLSPRDAYQQSMRIFRGTPPSGGTAFAKDACYARGFVTLARWLLGGDDQTAEDLALLTVGKTRREELPLLRGLVDANLLRRPRFVPPVFRGGLQTCNNPDVDTPGRSCRE